MGAETGEVTQEGASPGESLTCQRFAQPFVPAEVTLSSHIRQSWCLFSERSHNEFEGIPP